MDDKQILSLYRKRNQQAIAETDRAYGKPLHTLADRILHSFEDAQECVSDTYYKAWDTIPPQYPEHFFAYLAKICRNFAFGKLDNRHAAKRNAELISLSEELLQCVPASSMEETMESKAIAQSLNRFLETQNPENRVIFIRRYFYCDSVTEIAARLNAGESKIKTRLHRMRKALRTHLEQEGIEV